MLSITLTLHAGSSGSSIYVAHVWKTSLSMLQSKAVFIDTFYFEEFTAFFFVCLAVAEAFF